MQATLRLTLAAVLAAVVTGTVWTLTSGPGATADATDDRVTQPVDVVPARFTSSVECRECHQEVWDEWHGTQHQIAYENPAVRELSEDFRTKECQACHLPKPVFQTGLIQRTLPRVTRPSEGVGCLSCHEGPDGRIVGRHTNAQAPCTPIANTEFVSVALCETCHNQHGTTDEWRASPFFEKQDCNECHMLPVERANGRMGRSHVMPGGHDLTTLQKAGRFEFTRAEGEEDGTLRVALTNALAGHNYPTEERSRALDMMVRFLDEDGAPIAAELEISEVVPDTVASVDGWQCIHRFRNPYRDEPLPNSQLASGETYARTVRAPDGAVRAEAKLLYRRNPFAADDDPEVVVVEERTVELR